MTTGGSVLRMLRGTWLFLALAGAAGCGSGPTFYPVHGKVVYPDGSPVKGGAVMFEPVENTLKVMARGFIDNENGTFTLTTEKEGDGAMTGRYRVLVRGKGTPHGRGANPDPVDAAWEPPIHPRFQDFKTSGLEFTVEPKKNEFVITVEKAPKPRG